MILPLPLLRQALKRTDLPVLCGPFRGELGFECLYWVPWLRKLFMDCGVEPARVYPICRGGAHVWYGTPSAVELYGLRSVQDVRIETRRQMLQTGKQKQEQVSAFDKGVIRDAATALGLKRYLTIHPSAMYAALAPFWEAQQGIRWLYDRIALQIPCAATPPLPEGLTLPDQFIAARIYARPTWPINPVTTNFARESLRQVAEHVPVILLTHDAHLDDHVDFVPKPAIPNVHLLKDLTTVRPEHNLSVISAVLARAKAFVGTYGGLAQLALLYGKPTFSVYQEWAGTMLAHKHLMDALATQTRIPCVVHRLADSGWVQAVLPNVVTRRQDVATAP